MPTTFKSDMIVPEFFADEIQKNMGETTLTDLAVVEPYTGIGGDFYITKQAYLGDAVILEENEEVPFTKLSQSKSLITIHELAKGVEISDRAQIDGLNDPIGDTAVAIANTLDGGIDALIYKTLSDAKLTKEVVGISKNTILEATKVMKGAKDKKKFVVVNTANYAAIQQGYKTLSDSEVFDNIAGLPIHVSDRLADDEFFIVQEGAVKLKFTKKPSVESTRFGKRRVTEVIGTTFAGAWITNDSKVVKVKVLPEPINIEDVEGTDLP